MDVHKGAFQDSRLLRLGCALSSGILLGFSFPPSLLYSLAFIALIPFFYLFAQCESYRQFAWYSYLFLFVFHLLTVYWTGGFTVGKDVWMMIAGASVLTIHPFFFLPSILLSFFIKRRLCLKWGLIAFILFWTSFEYLHSIGEYSFPWLTIGNSQAYDITRIQILEYISIYGMSFLILIFNLLAFWLLWRLMDGKWTLRSRNSYFAILCLIVIYFGPLIYGSFVLRQRSFENGRKISLGIIQPNFDPWEKWGGSFGEKWESYINQLNFYAIETKDIANFKPDLVLWPETAIPFHLLLPRYSTYLSDLFRLSDSLNLSIFTGLPTVEYFDSLNAPATAQRFGSSNIYVESYNSTVLIQPQKKVGPIHRKTILVPFAERIPYAETFRFLIEPLKWNVGISSWGKGSDTVVNSMQLKEGGTAAFSGMICYESVYPNYVREFVRRGAEFLVILTNDSWWGNTSGAYQHASFIALRAVETRRWIVQCANGGISAIVDPLGVAHVVTDLYSRIHIAGNVYLKSEQTFYVQYGDIFGQCCIIVSCMLFVAAYAFKRFERR